MACYATESSSSMCCIKNKRKEITERITYISLCISIGKFTHSSGPLQQRDINVLFRKLVKGVVRVRSLRSYLNVSLPFLVFGQSRTEPEGLRLLQRGLEKSSNVLVNSVLSIIADLASCVYDYVNHRLVETKNQFFSLPKNKESDFFSFVRNLPSLVYTAL